MGLSFILAKQLTTDDIYDESKVMKHDYDTLWMGCNAEMTSLESYA